MGGGVRDIARLLHHLPDTTSLFEVEVFTQTWDENLSFPSLTAKRPPIKKRESKVTKQQGELMEFDL